MHWVFQTFIITKTIIWDFSCLEIEPKRVQKINGARTGVLTPFINQPNLTT